MKDKESNTTYDFKDYGKSKMKIMQDEKYLVMNEKNTTKIYWYTESTIRMGRIYKPSNVIIQNEEIKLLRIIDKLIIHFDPLRPIVYPQFHQSILNQIEDGKLLGASDASINRCEIGGYCKMINRERSICIDNSIYHNKWS